MSADLPPLPEPGTQVRGRISRSLGVVLPFRNEQMRTFTVRWPFGMCSIVGLNDVFILSERGSKSDAA
jgi:hypothetical protein